MSGIEILKTYISQNLDSIVSLHEKRQRENRLAEEHKESIKKQCSDFLMSFDNNFGISVVEIDDGYLLLENKERTLAKVDIKSGFSKDSIFIDWNFPSSDDKRPHMSATIRKNTNIDSFKIGFIHGLVHSYPEKFI